MKENNCCHIRVVRKRLDKKCFWNQELPKASKRGEYFYIAIVHASGDKPDWVKIGTSKSPYNRFYQHLDYYKTDITICWVSPPYSKYTTIRIEDKMREILKNREDFIYKNNDRFEYPESLEEIVVKVRREYHVKIQKFLGD